MVMQVKGQCLATNCNASPQTCANQAIYDCKHPIPPMLHAYPLVTLAFSSLSLSLSISATREVVDLLTLAPAPIAVSYQPHPS